MAINLTEQLKRIWRSRPDIDEDALRNARASGRDEITPLLEEARRSIRADGGPVTWRVLRNVERQLVLEDMIDGDDPERRELRVSLSTLRDGQSGARFRQFEDSDDWASALARAWAYDRITSLDSAINIDALAHRERALAGSVRALRAEGFGLRLQDGAIGSVEEISAIASALVQRAEGIHGTFRSLVFSLLDATYDASADHHMLGRRYPQGIEPMMPPTPFGYLYQLSVGMLRFNDGSPSSSARDEVHAVVALLTALATILDVVPYHWAEMMYSSVDDIEFVLADVALYDAAYVLKEMIPSHAIAMLDGLFAWADGHAVDSSVASMKAVMRAAYILAGRANGPVRLSVEGIAASAEITDSDAKAALELLSQDSDAVNDGLISPIDSPTAKAHAMFRPFVKIDDGFVMPQRLMCGGPAYEAIYAFLRGRMEVGEVDRLIGDALESLVKDLLRGCGLHVGSGDYIVGNENGQCDAVALTDRLIVFFECKKKSLTRRAMAGARLATLLDVQGALLQPHAQLARHECLLTRQSELRLSDGTVIVLGGRRIVKVAVTVVDFGTLADVNVQNNMLRNLMGAGLKLPPDASKAERKGACELELCAASLRASFEEMVARDAAFAKARNFNALTWSLPVLMTRLDGAKDPEEFERRMTLGAHMTFASGDQIEEYHRAVRLSDVAAQTGAPSPS